MTIDYDYYCCPVLLDTWRRYTCDYTSIFILIRLCELFRFVLLCIYYLYIGFTHWGSWSDHLLELFKCVKWKINDYI